MLLALIFAWLIAVNGDYAVIFHALRQGVFTTLWVSVVAYVLAAALGLVVAVGRGSRFRVIREVSTFYVEIVRGLPALVLLFYVAFRRRAGDGDGVGTGCSPFPSAMASSRRSPSAAST